MVGCSGGSRRRRQSLIRLFAFILWFAFLKNSIIIWNSLKNNFQSEAWINYFSSFNHFQDYILLRDFSYCFSIRFHSIQQKEIILFKHFHYSYYAFLLSFLDDYYYVLDGNQNNHAIPSWKSFLILIVICIAVQILLSEQLEIYKI